MGTPSYAGDFNKGLKAYNNKEYATALKEFKLVAEKYRGLAQSKGLAMYFLGQMYEKGKGVIKDFVIAHMWYNIGSSNGQFMAKLNRDFLVREMTPSQIEEAQRLARECVKKNYKDCWTG